MTSLVGVEVTGLPGVASCVAVADSEVKVGKGVAVSGSAVAVGSGVAVSGSAVEVDAGMAVSGSAVEVDVGVAVCGSVVEVGSGLSVGGGVASSAAMGDCRARAETGKKTACRSRMAITPPLTARRDRDLCMIVTFP